MPDFKEIKTNIEEIKVDMLNRQEERRSFNAPNPSLKEEEKKTVIEKKQPFVPIEQINKLPIAQKVRKMTAQEIKERREIFNDKAKNLHEKELLRLNIQVPTDRDNLVELRADKMEKYEYFDEQNVKHDDYRWKADFLWLIRKKC